MFRRLCLGLLMCITSFTSVHGDSLPLETIVSAVVRITDGPTSGTAFLVSVPVASGNAGARTVLVTAAHGFESMPAETCTIVLRRRIGEDRYERLEHPIKIREGGKPLWTRHPELDVAVLPLVLPEGAAVAPIPEDRLATEVDLRRRDVHVGQTVFIPGYPVKLEANGTGFPVVRQGTLASFPLFPVDDAKTILLDAKTFGGDSGAPVVAFVKEEPLVVGMVIGMHRQTDRSVLPFEERTVHTPLGIGIVVQAHFVRNTIGRLPSPSAGSP